MWIVQKDILSYCLVVKYSIRGVDLGIFVDFTCLFDENLYLGTGKFYAGLSYFCEVPYPARRCGAT